MRSLVVGALLCGMLVVAMPTHAQVPEPKYSLSVEADDAPITPITGAAQMPYTLTVTCDAGTPGPGRDPLVVVMDARSDTDWAVITMDKTQYELELPPHECLAGTEKRLAGNVSVMLTKDAPASEKAMITLTAAAGDEQVATTSWNVTSGVYHNAQVQFGQAIWKAPQGATLDLPLTIENFGNSAITPSFSLEDHSDGGLEVIRADDHSGELEIVLPDATAVAPGQKETFAVNVTTPSGQIYENRRDQIVIRVMLASDVDGSFDEPKQVTAVVQTQGTAAGESPLPPFPVLLLLVGAFLLRHGRRSKVLTTKRLYRWGRKNPHPFVVRSGAHATERREALARDRREVEPAEDEHGPDRGPWRR